MLHDSSFYHPFNTLILSFPYSPSGSIDKVFNIENSISRLFIIALGASFTQASSQSNYCFKLVCEALRQSGFPLAQKSFDLFMTSLSEQQPFQISSDCETGDGTSVFLVCFQWEKHFLRRQTSYPYLCKSYV